MLLLNLFVHTQVLELDNFGSMAHLLADTNHANVLEVKNMILKKLSNQMNLVTKTSFKWKHGHISGEWQFCLPNVSSLNLTSLQRCR